MKRLLYIIIAALFALLMLWVCEGLHSHETQQQDFDINGVWVNTHTTYFDSTGRVQIDRDETKEERHAYKLYADGIVYEYTMLPGGNGEPYFVPTSMEQYLLKPEFDTLYVEGNVLVPIVEMHDSVLIVRGSDYIQHWRRVTNVSQSQQKDMIHHSKLVLTHSPDLWKQELLHDGYISAQRAARRRGTSLLRRFRQKAFASISYRSLQTICKLLFSCPQRLSTHCKLAVNTLQTAGCGAAHRFVVLLPTKTKNNTQFRYAKVYLFSHPFRCFSNDGICPNGGQQGRR